MDNQLFKEKTSNKSLESFDSIEKLAHLNTKENAALLSDPQPPLGNIYF